jgi:hypothetical protein
MADMTADNAAHLARMGAPVTEGNLYLMHFLGPADARKVLHAAPETPLAGLIHEASIAANPTLLGAGKTAGDVIAWTDRKMGSAGSGDLHARVDVEDARIADADLAARLQAEADRLQSELADARRSAAEPVTQDDPVSGDSMRDGGESRCLTCGQPRLPMRNGARQPWSSGKRRLRPLRLRSTICRGMRLWCRCAMSGRLPRRAPWPGRNHQPPAARCRGHDRGRGFPEEHGKDGQRIGCAQFDGRS